LVRWHVCSHILHPPSLVCSFTATATTEIYTLSLHDALPIFDKQQQLIALLKEKRQSVLHSAVSEAGTRDARLEHCWDVVSRPVRSEEHTSELQSRENLVCRLLLEKKKKEKYT